MALALLVRSETHAVHHRLRASVAALALLSLLAAPGVARAYSIAIDPPSEVCSVSSCGDLTVQVILEPLEIDVDGFAFEISVSDASLVSLAVGPVPGNPITGFDGFFDLDADGFTLHAELDSSPANHDGPLVLNIATIPLSPNGNGTVEFRFISSEVSAGPSPLTNSINTPNQLLATVTVVPEPGTFSLLALGLAGVAARSRARAQKGGIQ